MDFGVVAPPHQRKPDSEREYADIFFDVEWTLGEPQGSVAEEQFEKHRALLAKQDADADRDRVGRTTCSLLACNIELAD
jgi:hypothetical protein